MTRSRALLLGVLLAVVAAAGWWLFPSNARRVRTRFERLATLVTVPPAEQDLARLARARQFGALLAADVEVIVEDAVPIGGRDTLMALVARPSQIAGGVNVALSDIAVQVAAGGVQAASTARARLTYTDPQTRRPAVEDHLVSLEWRKLDGEWLVAVVTIDAASAISSLPAGQR